MGFHYCLRCEKENSTEEIIQTDDQESGLVLKHFSRKDIDKNPKLISKLEKFNDKLIRNKSARLSDTSIYNSEYDFTVYTNSANFIENGDYHSYTFPIVQDDDDKIKNVLFELNDKKEYEAFLVEYDYTANELKHQDINSLSLKTSIKPINLDFNSLFAKTKSAYVCIYSYEKICTDGWVEGSGGNLVGADNNNEGCFWVLTASYCETVLYADEDYTNYHNNNTATVTISGTTYGGTSGGSSTSPMPSPFDSKELMKINVVKSELELNHLERLWIDEYINAQIAFKLYDFGVTHLWTDDAKNFAKAAVVAFLNGGEVDWVNEVILDKSFLDNEKAKCVYDKVTQNINFKTLINVFTGEETPNLTFKITPNLQCANTQPNGCTRNTLNSDNSITIELDQAYINSNQTPTLLIAETIVHEAIHANLFLAVYNNENGNTANIPEIDDFASIYEQYRQQEDWQHEFMAAEYTELIAQILQKIHPFLNDQQYIDTLSDFDFSIEQFYTCLAYTGLNGTVGQANFLSILENSNNYNSSYYDVRANSTKEPNCY